MFSFVQSLRCDCPSEYNNDEPPTTVIKSPRSNATRGKRKKRDKYNHSYNSLHYSKSNISGSSSFHTDSASRANLNGSTYYFSNMLQNEEVERDKNEKNEIEKSHVFEEKSNLSQSFADLTVETNETIDNEVKRSSTSETLFSSNEDSSPERVEKEAYEKSFRQSVDDRWQISHPSVNLTGEWELIVSSEWKKDYDTYLTCMGYNIFQRKVAVTVIHLTREEIFHWNESNPIDKSLCDDGVDDEILLYEKERRLRIVSINPKGKWDRTFISSGATSPGSSAAANYSNPLCSHSSVSEEYQRIILPMKIASGDLGETESWWERNGTAHRSWIRNTPKGDYESLRYFEEGSEGNIYVCESYFYEKIKNEADLITATSEKPHATAQITWRFQRKA